MKKALTLLLIPIIFLWLPAVASDVFDIAEKYNKEKNQVVGLESKKRRVLAEIFSIEKENRKLVLQKTNLDDKKMKLDYELAKTSKRIVEIEKELNLMAPELIERVTFLEQMQKLPWFYAFLTSQSIEDLDRLEYTASQINSQQALQLKKYVHLHKTLGEEQRELRQTALEIVKLKKEMLAQEKRISKNQSHKHKMLKSLNMSLSSHKKNLNFLKLLGRKAVKKSEFKDLGLLFGTDFFDKKGKLPQPIDGPLVQNFGLIESLSQDQVELMHKGHFYKTSSNKTAKSIAAGRVRYVGSVKGYGRVVILDHGGRYYSLYSNLKKTRVKPGDVLKEKQVLGETGHRHLLFGQGLYFEIRHFSEPQNPQIWLEAPKGRLATL